MKAALPLLLLLAGCAATPAGPDSPGYAYPAQTRLMQRQSLPVEADAASVRMQGGRVVARNAVQEHNPYCVLELDRVDAAPRRLEPATYAVERVTRQMRTFAAAPARVAANDDGGSLSHLYYQTVFRLVPNAAGAGWLTCMHNQPPGASGAYERHLTLAEIRAALGDLIHIELPG